MILGNKKYRSLKKQPKINTIVIIMVVKKTRQRLRPLSPN